VARVEAPPPDAVSAGRVVVPEELRRQSVAPPFARAGASQRSATRDQSAEKEAVRQPTDTPDQIRADAVAGARRSAVQAGPTLSPLAETAKATPPPQASPAAAAAQSAATSAADASQSAPVAAPAPGAPAEPATAFARIQTQRAFAPPIEIVSSDPAFRWRLCGQSVEHSADRGASWQPAAAGATAALTAGAAPSPSVCWLVGRGGLVLLTTDGRTWRRVPFPSPADLTGVQSTDATGRSATIVTTDGQTFDTANAGATWIRR
jgi:hypothetical protein